MTIKNALAVLFLAFSACTSSQTPREDLSEKPDQWVEKFKITETRTGVPVWVLNSGSAQVFNKDNKVVLEDVSINFMNPTVVHRKESRKSLLEAKKSLKLRARLVAPKGEVRMDTHDLSAWGGVEVESEDGTRLYTERLNFISSQNKIMTDSPIKIVRKDSTMIGEGLETTPDLSTVRIFRHQASIFPKKVKL